jgi:hypothetical protein
MALDDHSPIGFGAEVYKCEKICIKTNEFLHKNFRYKFVPVRSIVLEDLERIRENSPETQRASGRITGTCTHPPESPYGKHSDEPEGKLHCTAPRARTSSSGDHIR